MPLTTEDVIAIEHLISRYNFAFDSGDATAFADCFTEDGRFTVAGEQVARGPDSLAAYVESTKTPGQLRHVVTSILLDGNTAQASNRCYCTVFSSNPGAGSHVLAQGVYQDLLAKRADGWRFTERRFAPDPT